MTPEERQKRIKALEAELEELKKAGNSAKRFWELMSGTEVKVDFETYPNRIFGFRGNKYVWEFDFKLKNYYLRLRYEELWAVLVEEFGLVYHEIQSLVKNEVESHFNCKEITPVIAGDDDADAVEGHFNGRSERTTITKENAPTNKIVIEVKGGNVIAVFSTQKDLQVIILDYDNFADGKEMDETEREAERQIKNKEGIYYPVFSLFKTYFKT